MAATTGMRCVRRLNHRGLCLNGRLWTICPRIEPIRNVSVSRGINWAKHYTEKHEWAEIRDNTTVATIGITNHAQDALGDVVYVSLPEVGDNVSKDGECGALESVKAASDVYSPVEGEVVKVNEKLEGDPGLVNRDPEGEGWLYQINMADSTDVDGLMSEEQYNEFVKDDSKQ